MAGTMSRADLVADLKDSLLDAAGVFAGAPNAAFERHLNAAALALTPHRPHTAVSSLALVAGQPNYAAPADLWRYKASNWGAARAQPWEKAWPGRLPDVREVGAELWLVPAPTAHQIAVLGAAFTFFYYAAQTIGDAAADTTVSPADRGLLLLRAQAEAMRELAMRDSVRPTTVRDGFSSQPKTGTPAGLCQAMLAEFDARLKAAA